MIMKYLNELDFQCSTVTHHYQYSSPLNFNISSEVMITWKIDGVVYKLKPKLFWEVCITKVFV